MSMNIQNEIFKGVEGYTPTVQTDWSIRKCFEEMQDEEHPNSLANGKIELNVEQQDSIIRRVELEREELRKLVEELKKAIAEAIYGGGK